MTQRRITQGWAEAIGQEDEPRRVTQNWAEAVGQEDPPRRVTQVWVEVVSLDEPEPEAADDRRTFLSLRRRGSHPLL